MHTKRFPGSACDRKKRLGYRKKCIENDSRARPGIGKKGRRPKKIHTKRFPVSAKKAARVFARWHASASKRHFLTLFARIARKLSGIWKVHETRKKTTFLKLVGLTSATPHFWHFRTVRNTPPHLWGWVGWVGWWVGGLVGWLAGWLVGWLAGWLVGWLAGGG